MNSAETDLKVFWIRADQRWMSLRRQPGKIKFTRKAFLRKIVASRLCLKWPKSIFLMTSFYNKVETGWFEFPSSVFNCCFRSCGLSRIFRYLSSISHLVTVKVGRNKKRRKKLELLKISRLHVWKVRQVKVKDTVIAWLIPSTCLSE